MKWFLVCGLALCLTACKPESKAKQQAQIQWNYDTCNELLVIPLESTWVQITMDQTCASIRQRGGYRQAQMQRTLQCLKGHVDTGKIKAVAHVEHYTRKCFNQVKQ